MEILRCTSCSQYTLRPHCPRCSQSAITPKPAKYSPEDKYGEWRRKAKLSLK